MPSPTPSAVEPEQRLVAVVNRRADDIGGRTVRDRPLINCRINPRDKRKIDVCMTDAGERALTEYQALRVDRIIGILRDLPEDEQEEFNRLVDKLRGLLERGGVS